MSGGRASRQKGDRRERQWVALHTEIGTKAERVPLSGATHYKGNGCDVDVYVRGPDAPPWTGEVKSRADGEGFKLIVRWLGESDYLALIADRSEPLIVLPWSKWAELLKAVDSGTIRNAGP
jgi:hypothetical protein